MKTLLWIFAVFFMATSCDSQKKITNNTVNTDNKSTAVISTIELKEQTRGYYRNVLISSEKTDLFLDRKESNYKTTSVTWNTIQKLISTISLEKLSTYAAPSHENHSDGALAATITITVGDKQYISTQFDEGRPPKELADLYWALSSNFGSKKMKVK